MAFYLVRYIVGKNNEYEYPDSLKRVIWKSSLYHPSESLMIGETEDDVDADGNDIVSLTSDEAEKLKDEYQSDSSKTNDNS